MRPGEDVALVIGGVCGAAVFDRAIVRVSRVGAHRINELELVLDVAALLHLLEEIVDALLLHQPADKVEVRLPVLNAVIQFTVGRRQRERNIIEAVVLENLLDDARHGHFLGRFGHHRMENPAIRRARQKPEPRHDRGLVNAEPLGAGTLHEGTDVPAELPFLGAAAHIRHAPANGDALADQLQKIHRRLFAEEFCLHLKRTTQLLGDVEALEQEFVLAQRRKRFFRRLHVPKL